MRRGKSAIGNPLVRQQKQPLWLLWDCLLLPSCMSSSSSSFSLLLLLFFIYLRLSVCLCHSLLLYFFFLCLNLSISFLFSPYIYRHRQTDRQTYKRTDRQMQMQIMEDRTGGQTNRQIQMQIWVDRRNGQIDEYIDVDIGKQKKCIDNKGIYIERNRYRQIEKKGRQIDRRNAEIGIDRYIQRNRHKQIEKMGREIDRQIDIRFLSPKTQKNLENHEIKSDLLHKIILQLHAAITDFSLLCSSIWNYDFLSSLILVVRVFCSRLYIPFCRVDIGIVIIVPVLIISSSLLI